MQVQCALRSLVRDYTMQTPLASSQGPSLWTIAEAAAETCSWPDSAWAAL